MASSSYPNQTYPNQNMASNPHPYAMTQPKLPQPKPHALTQPKPPQPKQPQSNPYTKKPARN